MIIDVLFLKSLFKLFKHSIHDSKLRRSINDETEKRENYWTLRVPQYGPSRALSAI